MIGQTVSHYRILEKLGEGGMGVVYRAEDTRLDRSVALKFLSPALATQEATKKRFIYEAKAASSLDHPNICVIYEIDETPEGQMFIAMPHYEGETLQAKIAKGPIEVGEAIDIVLQLASGLAKAHEKGIVHRDIKPGNIIITRDGPAKIVDFGLAKLAGRTKVTKTGTTVGTAAYMSPEQARGEEVDERSDIFSLGSVLYELVTGRLPFAGPVEAAVVYELVHQDPEPVTNFRDEVPAELEWIIERAMKKDVSERYQTAADLTNDLERLKTAPSAPASAKTGARVGWRRLQHRYLIALALIAIVVVAALVMLPQWGRVPQGQELALAVVDFRDLETQDDPAVSAGMMGLLQAGLVESSPIRVVSPEYLYDLRRRRFGTARGAIDAGQALELARESSATMLLSGQIAVSGDDPYVTWWLVDTRSGESLAAQRVEGNKLIDLADNVIAAVLPVVARECGAETPISAPTVGALTTESPDAYRHYLAGILAYEQSKAAEAIRELEQAVAIDSAFALAFFDLSRVCHSSTGVQEPERARGYAEKAWTLRSRLGIKERMRLEAWRYELDERYGAVRTTYEEMLTRWPDDRTVLGNFSMMLFFDWSFGESGSVAERGLALYPDDVGLGLCLLYGLSYTGRPAEALEAARVFRHRHADNPSAWDELGWRYFGVGLPDSAEWAFRRASEIDSGFVESKMGIAACAYSRGDADRAIELFEDYLDRSDLHPWERMYETVDVENFPRLALLYAETGRYKDAMDAIDQARLYVSDQDAVERIETNRNLLLLRMGRFQEVLQSARMLEAQTDDVVTRWRALRVRARALVGLDSLEAAKEAVAELESLKDVSYVKFSALKATTEIALAEEKPEEALAILGQMLAQGVGQYALLGIEHWEMVARAHRMAGRLEEAARIHRELLRVHGGHALSHYELGRIYEEMGRVDDALDEYTRFLEMWSHADGGLPQLEAARSRLSAMTTQL